jgi:hypothetical protein
MVYNVEDSKNDAAEKEMRKIVKNTEPDVTVKAV